MVTILNILYWRQKCSYFWFGQFLFPDSCHSTFSFSICYVLLLFGARLLKQISFSVVYLLHYKDSMPYSQYLCIKWTCSTLSDFDRHMNDITQHFPDRGIPMTVVHEAAIKARKMNGHNLFHPSKHSSTMNTDRSILVTTFHPEEES